MGDFVVFLKETKKTGHYCNCFIEVILLLLKKNLVIIASGHWKRKNGCLARAVQVVVDCPKMAALEKKNFVNINLRHKTIFYDPLALTIIVWCCCWLATAKNTLNLDKLSIIFWSRWMVLCPIVLSQPWSRKPCLRCESWNRW